MPAPSSKAPTTPPSPVPSTPATSARDGANRRLRAALTGRRKGRLRGLQRAGHAGLLSGSGSLRRQALRLRPSATLRRGFSRQPRSPLRLWLRLGRLDAAVEAAIDRVAARADDAVDIAAIRLDKEDLLAAAKHM